MSGNFGIRTDLAVESKEKYEKDNVEIKGVAIQEKYEDPNLNQKQLINR